MQWKAIWLQQVSIIPIFYILLAKLCNNKNSFNELHSHANLHHTSYDKLLQLVKLQHKCIHKAKKFIYKQRNSSLTCSRNLTISYQANSMVTFSAENRLLVNHLDSHRWWNLLFHSCQSLYPYAYFVVDGWCYHSKKPFVVVDQRCLVTSSKNGSMG